MEKGKDCEGAFFKCHITVPQLGEVRDFQHHIRLELLNLKFRTICQTKQQTPHLAKLLLCTGFLINQFEMKKIHINNDDNYATPPDFYEQLNSRFNFDFDPCPYNENDIVNDGLKIEWGKSNFVNPPYSQKLKEEFIKKGVEEMKKGKLCVFLIPVSTSTKLFHEWIKPNATEIEFVRGRIKFGKRDKDGNFYLPLNKDGKTQSGTKDSMIVVFDGRY